MDNDPSGAVYFQKNYAWANNWGRVVGFAPHHLLVLERGKASDSWCTERVPAASVLRIRVRQFRSVYVVIMGTIASAVAVFVAYVGLTGEATGPGILTIPVVCAVFAYCCFRWSTRLHIAFDVGDKQLAYKSWPGSIQETLAALPPLVQWARSESIPIDLAIKIPAWGASGWARRTEGRLSETVAAWSAGPVPARAMPELRSARSGLLTTDSFRPTGFWLLSPVF
jgi:hypothetical protein